jgi:hypothetical protein
MHTIEKIDLMETLFRKTGSKHEPEALDAARRLRDLSIRWGIDPENLHSTSPTDTVRLRRRVTKLWKRIDQHSGHRSPIKTEKEKS